MTTYTEVPGITVPDNIRAVHLNNYYGADDARDDHPIYVQERHRRNNGQWTDWAEFSDGRVYGNYKFYSERGVLAIAKLAVTIAAADNTKVFGTDDPTLVGKPLQVVTDRYTENIDYSYFTIEREKGEDVGGGSNADGTYPITITAKTEKVEDKDVPTYLSAYAFRNYDVTISETPGKFTITPQGIKVIANDQVVDYGKAINPYDVTIKIDNVAQEWTEEQIAAVLSLSTTYTSVGAHANAYTATPAENANYAFNPATDFTNGYLTIYPLKVIPLGKDALAEITSIPLAQVLEDHKGKNVKVILPPRKMEADEWYTWVLPFDVKPSVLFGDDKWGYGAAETLDVNKTKGENVVFALQVMDAIPANTPFIAKIEGKENTAEAGQPEVMGIKAATMGAISFDVTLDNSIDYVNAKPTAAALDGSVKFIGLYEETEEGFFNNKKLMYNAKAGDPAEHPHREFWVGGPNSKKVIVGRTNAYLEFTTEQAAAKARIFVEDEDGTLTAINGVDAEAEVAYGEGWYTINGVKLEGEPTTTGTYIFNGKKVFIQK